MVGRAVRLSEGKENRQSLQRWAQIREKDIVVRWSLPGKRGTTATGSHLYLGQQTSSYKVTHLSIVVPPDQLPPVNTITPFLTIHTTTKRTNKLEYQISAKHLSTQIPGENMCLWLQGGIFRP